MTKTDAVALNALIKDERIQKLILDDLSKQAKRVGLNGFEMVKKIHLTWEKFTQENDTLTPSFKIKRCVYYIFFCGWFFTDFQAGCLQNVQHDYR